MTTRAEQSSPWLGFSPGAGGAGPSAPAQRFWASLGVLRPTLEWGTFLLMLSVVFTATWSVQSAGWTLTPPLMLATLIGYAAGAGLAKARISPWVLQSVGFTSGLLTIVTLLLVFLEGPGWFAGIHQIGYRIGAWAIAARSGGISTDALPFAVSLVAVTWFLGYVAGWFAFRRNNVWIAVALAGVGLLTNLSYLPSAFWSYFYLYLSLSMLTLAWAGILERRRVWEQDRINHPTG
ncbi:MAG: hypothetical protein HY532_05905, partial [Chloroflexi bacterium]|nr:hypothetical protein [Chloroflexota bacterium]